MLARRHPPGRLDAPRASALRKELVIAAQRSQSDYVARVVLGEDWVPGDDVSAAREGRVRQPPAVRPQRRRAATRAACCSALRETAGSGDEMLETHKASAPSRSLRADVFHSPWMAGAMLHSPCPMVVTLHDLAALKRRSEHLRTGRAPAPAPPRRAARGARDRAHRGASASDAVDHLRPRARARRRDPRGRRRRDVPALARSEVAAARARFGAARALPGVGRRACSTPIPSKHVAELAATPRELPLVLVGPTRPWAHELPDVILTGHVSDDAARRHLQRRARARAALRGGGLRPARRRGARLRHAGRRLRRPGAARGARRARHVRRGRRPAALIDAAEARERPAPPPPRGPGRTPPAPPGSVYARAPRRRSTGRAPPAPRRCAGAPPTAARAGARPALRRRVSRRPRCESTAGIVFSRIVRSSASDQRSR